MDFDIDFHYEDFYAGIIKEGNSIHLKLGERLIEERRNRRSNEDFKLEIIFSVDGIENLYEELLSKMVEIIQPLRDMPYGKEFYVADPDGNIIAFME